MVAQFFGVIFFLPYPGAQRRYKRSYFLRRQQFFEARLFAAIYYADEETVV
jgi:hypothetical protein